MTADRAHHHDPGSRFEDAGIPDLQDGTPQQQQAEDPQEMPLPGESPNAAVDWGITAEEQREGEPHSRRLAREVPDPALAEIGDDREGTASSDVESSDIDARGDETAADVAVGRLANEQGVVPGDGEVDTEATDVGTDSGGLTPEEQAMHLDPE